MDIALLFGVSALIVDERRVVADEPVTVEDEGTKSNGPIRLKLRGSFGGS